jgi:Secretory lipase
VRSGGVVPFAALRTAVLAAASLLLAAVSSSASAASFYEPPSPLPNSTPGALLRAERFEFRGLTRPPAGTIGWRILYVSRTALGAPVAVSGAVLLPSSSAEPRPLVALAPGAHGLGDQCAASKLLAAGAESELDNAARLLRDGDAVVITDYQGLGTPGPHPFAVNRAAGRNVLDALRAARQVPGTGLAPDGPLGLYGYSQGGGAVGSAVEQQPTYAPELRIEGAVVGGALAEPARLPSSLFGNFWAGLVIAAAIGYDSAYPELGLSGSLSQFGRDAFSATSKRCMELGAPLQYAQMEWFTKRGTPLTSPAWQARLKENALGAGAPRIPIYQFHAIWDQVLLYSSARRVRAGWCAAGASVRFVTVQLTAHFTGGPGGLDGAARWLAGRFAGKPPGPNC